jgi:hypothetical protein
MLRNVPRDRPLDHGACASGRHMSGFAYDDQRVAAIERAERFAELAPPLIRVRAGTMQHNQRRGRTVEGRCGHREVSSKIMRSFGYASISQARMRRSSSPISTLVAR